MPLSNSHYPQSAAVAARVFLLALPCLCSAAGCGYRDHQEWRAAPPAAPPAPVIADETVQPLRPVGADTSAARRAPDTGIARCTKNMETILAALKRHEADHGRLPVHQWLPEKGHGTDPEFGWQVQLDPYLRNPRTYLCPNDTTGGAVHEWTKGRPSSYAYCYTIVHVKREGGYRRPSKSSPLLICNRHPGYRFLLGLNDASIQLEPRGRRPGVGIEFDARAGASQKRKEGDSR